MKQFNKKKTSKHAMRHKSNLPRSVNKSQSSVNSDDERELAAQYGSDVDNEVVVNQYWYDQFADDPSGKDDCLDSEITSLRIEAQTVLENETSFYNTNQARKGRQSDRAWMKAVLSKGTASDKLAAYTVMVQESPIHNLAALTTLLNMVKVAKKKQCILVMDTLCELFLADLLIPGRMLFTFDRQPLSKLYELSGGDAMLRRQRLIAYLFEDRLKDMYHQFVAAVDVVGKDTVDANRERAVTVFYKLLAANPEQEETLLRCLVNKLGDPSQKVASKVIYSLTQLLRENPDMKQVVMNEVEKLIFRPNIGLKAQYYGVCFLSQFHFRDHDKQLAQDVIGIYFSFFKACIKKGEVDSRLMAALLMGVKRAYPFAKLQAGQLSEHIDTLYKLVHLAGFSISLHTLCLLQQVAGAGMSQDRFYSALYKKMLDPKLATSTHQAVFINLVYKSLSKDANIPRVKAFIKRLLQVCCYMPVPLAVGILFMCSQLIKQRRFLEASISVKQESACIDDDDDEDEVYKDAPEETNETSMSKCDGSDKTKVDEKPTPATIGWLHCKISKRRPAAVDYNPTVRNPCFANSEAAAYTELSALARHFHPTVALFAANILRGEVVEYLGDPLVDFTLVRFLERFVFKNPKQVVVGAEEKGPDPVLAQRKHYLPTGPKAIPITSHSYLSQGEDQVPVDELFLYRYLREYRTLPGERDGNGSDADSVASDEFEAMLQGMQGGKPDKHLDFMEEVGTKLSAAAKDKGKKGKPASATPDTDAESEDDLDDEEEDDIESDDDDAEALDFDEDAGSLDSELDLENIEDISSDEECAKKPMHSKKGKWKGGEGISGMFAPAEQFSEILEEAGLSGLKAGSAHTLSNKDNADMKQLSWETSRNSWLTGKRKERKLKGGNARKRSKK